MKNNAVPSENKTVVIRKCPVWEMVALFAGTILFLLGGILLLILPKNPGNFLGFAFCLFFGACVTAAFIVDYVWFSLKVEDRKVTIRRLFHGTETYSFLEFGWKVTYPERKHSPVSVYGKGKVLTTVHFGAPGSEFLFTFNHTGKLNDKEREYLRRNGL